MVTWCDQTRISTKHSAKEQQLEPHKTKNLLKNIEKGTERLALKSCTNQDFYFNTESSGCVLGKRCHSQ